MVRGLTGRMDYMHAFLPAAASGRLRIRASQRPAPQPAHAGGSSHGPAPGDVPLAADRPLRKMETSGNGESGVAHSRLACREHWLALFSPLCDDTFASILVRQKI